MEYGGDPLWIDDVAYQVRPITRKFPKWITEKLPSTITREPTKTSFGYLSMQIEVALETLGHL